MDHDEAIYNAWAHPHTNPQSVFEMCQIIWQRILMHHGSWGSHLQSLGSYIHIIILKTCSKHVNLYYNYRKINLVTSFIRIESY